MDSVSETNLKQRKFENRGLQIKDIVVICVGKWKWISAFAFICVCFGVIYLLAKQPVYTRQAQILIKENSNNKDNFVGNLSTVSDLGMFNNGINVNNELTCIQSPALIADVIKRLNLEVDYKVDGRIGKEIIYGSALPIQVRFNGLEDNEDCKFKLFINADSTKKIEIKELTIGGKIYNGEWKGELGDSIILSRNIMVEIIKNPLYNPIKTNDEDTLSSFKSYYIEKLKFIKVVESYAERLKANLVNKQTTIFNLTFEDVSAERAEVFLSKLIDIYNENWISEKNAIAENTNNFINNRLKLTEQDLGYVDNSISSYKSKNLTPDLTEVAKIHLGKASVANDKAAELGTQLDMALYMRDCVANNKNRALLPSVDILKNSMIDNYIDQYNSNLMQRNRLAENSSGRNPLVADLDKKLSSLEKSIIESIDNHINSLKQQINVLRDTEARSTARVASSPTQEKYLLSAERQQKVKETLYLFLLQKREENELARAYSEFNTRVITPPTGGLEPTSPIKRNVLLLCLIVGILIPVIAIYLIELFNNQIRGSKDLEQLTVPLIGEIPLLKEKRQEVVVKEGGCDNINEAFRIVRTNIIKELGKEENRKTIAVTSMNLRSGKTFTSLNIAKALSLMGFKVVLVDMDLRRANLSKLFAFSDKGLCSYLKDGEKNVEKLIKPIDADSNMHLLPVGDIPNNPTELLSVSKLDKLIGELKEIYDYVILNCPPIEVVADTSIIAPLADLTIFVMRVRMFSKSKLSLVQKLYDTNKYGSMALLLNAKIQNIKSRPQSECVYG